MFIMTGQEEKVRTLLIQENTPIAPILMALFEQTGQSMRVLREAIEEEGRFQVARLDRYLGFLGSIAGAAPLLGLLGTVFGIMHAFAAIGTVGMGNPKQLASGIAEALITTAAGLLVAIPSLMAYRMLRSRVDTLVLRIERDALRIANLLAGEH